MRPSRLEGVSVDCLRQGEFVAVVAPQRVPRVVVLPRHELRDAIAAGHGDPRLDLNDAGDGLRELGHTDGSEGGSARHLYGVVPTATDLRRPDEQSLSACQLRTEVTKNEAVLEGRICVDPLSSVIV